MHAVNRHVIVQGINVTALCVQLLQQVSQSDPLISCTAFMLLIAPSQPPDVQLSGLALMQQVVRKRWQLLTEAQQAEVATQVVSIGCDRDFLARGSWPLKSKLSSLISDLIIRRGSPFAETQIQKTIELVEAGVGQGLLVLQSSFSPDRC